MHRRTMLVGLGTLFAGCSGSGNDTATTQVPGETTEPAMGGESSPQSPGGADAQSGGGGGGGTLPAPASGTRHELGESFVVGAESIRLEYTVADASTQSTVGDPAQEPAGTFVIISITIENVGEGSLQVSSDQFELIDSTGDTYTPDTSAMTYVESSLSSEQIEAGATLEGVVVFDVRPNRSDFQLRIDPIGIPETRVHFVEFSI